MESGGSYLSMPLVWRRIHITATSVRDIYYVVVPETNLSKLSNRSHAAQAAV